MYREGLQQQSPPCSVSFTGAATYTRPLRLRNHIPAPQASNGPANDIAEPISWVLETSGAGEKARATGAPSPEANVERWNTGASEI